MALIKCRECGNDVSSNAETQKTFIITSGGKGLLADEIAIDISGRTAGSINAYYTGYGDDDSGEDYTDKA